MTNPAAVPSVADVDVDADDGNDDDDGDSCVVCEACGEEEATLGVSFAGGGVGVGAGVDDVEVAAPARVNPGVNGCVANIERSTSRNRI